MTGGDHCPRGGLRRQHGAPNVELHDPVPVRARVFLGLVEDLAGATADGVDDDVDAPKPADRFLDRAFGLGLDRHVAADRQAL